MIRLALWLSFIGFCLIRCLTETPAKPSKSPPDTCQAPKCYPDPKPPKP